ncbi:HEAT repeat domain-containing protein [Myxococcus fulvus]|nr:HEAT repeat domain-containing protein [Myxococcus fulvus]
MLLLGAMGLSPSAAQASEPRRDSRPVPGILAALDDPDGTVVAQAVIAFCNVESLDEEVQAKLAEIERGPLPWKWLVSENLEEAALTLLRATKTSKEQPPPGLVELLNHSDAVIRRRAVSALGVMKSRAEKQAPLVRDLLRDTSPLVRQAAAQVLPQMGDGGVAQAPLIAEMLEDADPGIRLSATQAFKGMGRMSAITSHAPRIAERLKDTDPSVQATAAAALAAMGEGGAAYAPRVAELLKVTDVNVRGAAAKALGKMRTEDAAENASRVAALLEDPDASVRGAAASALGTMGVDAAEHAQLLIELLSKPPPAVQGEAEQALVNMTRAGVFQPSYLVDRLDDSDPRVRRMAVNGLGSRIEWAPEQAPVVARLLEDSDKSVRDAAAFALKYMGETGRAQTSRVVGVLLESSHSSRLVAADLLGLVGENLSEHAGRAAMLLRDSNAQIRMAAFKALSTMGKDAAAQAPLVANLLSDLDPRVRQAAAETLGRMGAGAAAHAPHVAALLHGQESSVQRAAVDALGAMGKDAAEHAPLVAKRLRDSDVETYRSARTTLVAFSPLESSVIATIVEAMLANDARSSELLALAHVAGNGASVIENVLRWPARRAEPQPARISLEEARETLSAFRVFWTSTTEKEHPLLRDALAISIEAFAKLQTGNWDTQEDRELLEELHGLLVEKHSLRAATLKEMLTSQRGWEWPALKWVPLLHATVWFLLIFLYPRSRQVQAVFFWNRRVRQVLGFPYVGLLLTWVPFLRQRLLSPFKRGLTADAALDAFVPDAYFPELEAREPALKTRGRLANLLPHLSGHVVLEGASGLGKSTYLKHLLSKSTRTSVFLRADRCHAGVLEAIQSKLEGYAKDSVFLKSLIFSGALDVYIDGLNEVSADVRARVVQFMEENLQGNILVTTQRIEWTPPSTARLLVLEPLSDSAITGFLKSREPFLDGAATLGGDSYATRCECFVKDALSTAQDGQSGRSLREVLSNPLDLTVVAQMLRNGQTPDLSQLRQQQYELMAREYAQAHLSEFPLGRFAEEAYQMRKASRSTLDEAAFSLELLTLERAKLVLRRQWKRPDGKDQQEWRFRHDKIQEFFVAQTFLDASKSRELEHMGDPPFRGVYFFLMAYLSLERAQMLCGLLVEHAAETGDHSVSDECVKLLKARARDACMPSPGKVVELGKRNPGPV